ncbi:MAG: hypothetical protein U0610_32810 [bacterium]
MTVPAQERDGEVSIRESPGRAATALLERWATILVVLYGSARLALLAFSDLHARSLFFAAPDDAFYYLQIAWNLSRGLGSTFDGIHLTNGYQPAWCLLLVPVAWLARSRAALFDASIGLACVLHVGAGVVLVSVARRLFAGGWPVLVALAWFASPRLDNFVHLESPLNALSLALVLLAAIDVARDEPAATRATPSSVDRRARDWARLGVALAFASLTRLDNAIFVPIAVLAAWLGEPGDVRSRLRAAMRVALPAALTLATYALVNRAYIGAWLPVSGTLKAEMLRSEIRNLLLGPGWTAIPGFLSKQLGIAVMAGPGAGVASWVFGAVWVEHRASMVVPVALVVAAILACRAGWTRSPKLARAWLATLLGIGAHFVFMLCMVGSFPREWHFIPEVMVLILAAGIGVPRMIAACAPWKARGGSWARVALTALLATAVGWRVHEGYASARSSFEWGHLMRNDQLAMGRYWGGQLPAGTRVGAWNAGYLAYFSDLQVVNLDGLVNEPSFAAQIADDRWLEYCQRKGIAYVIDTWGGAFDLLAKQTEIAARRHFSPDSRFEYVMLRIPSPSG